MPGYGMGIGQIETMVSEKLAAELLKIENEKNKAELELLRKEKEDPAGFKSAISGVLSSINDQAPQLLPVMAAEIMGIIRGIFGKHTLAGHEIKPGAPAYMPKTETTTNNNLETMEQNLTAEQVEAIENELDQNQDQYAAVLLRLRMQDNDLLQTLTKMAEKAEANPSLIPMLKSML
jgi:hypothetical protein